MWLLLTTERSQHLSHCMCQQATFTTGLLSDFCKGAKYGWVTHLSHGFAFLGTVHTRLQKGFPFLIVEVF